MAQIIKFPGKHVIQSKNTEQNLENDPYYRFIRNVLSTADSCGFRLPFTVDSAAEHVYQKTKHRSQLARMLRKQAGQ